MKTPDPKYEVPEPSFPVVAAMARQMEVALLDRCYHVEIPPGGETGRLRLTGNHSSINYLRSIYLLWRYTQYRAGREHVVDLSHAYQDVDSILPDLVSGWCDWPVQQIQYKQQSRGHRISEMMALSKLNPWGSGFTLCHQPLLLGEGVSLLIY